MPAPCSFGNLPPEYSEWDNSRFVVVPIPYDVTAAQTGASAGASAIIEASQHLQHEVSEICRAGAHTLAPVESVERPERMAVRVTEIIGRVLFADKVPVLLGGDHSVTFGAVCAALKLDLPDDLTVVQLDARPDLYQEYSGTKWGHRSIGRRMAALPGVQLVQAGLRTAAPEEYSDRPANVVQFWCDEMLRDFPAAIEQIVTATGRDVYLSLDVSVCAASWMNPTGALEPGGLSFDQTRDLMQAICAQRRVLGFDCVELRGDYPASALNVARLICATMAWISGN